MRLKQAIDVFVLVIQNENFSTIYNKFNSDLFTMLHDVSIF